MKIGIAKVFIVGVSAALMAGPALAEKRVPSVAELKSEIEMQRKQENLVPLGTISEIMHVCRYNLPPGWAKINDYWSPTSCGNPPRIDYNVWMIQRYDNMPVGSYMDVCSDSIPSGWMVINTRWNPTTCGHPPHIYHNVSTIMRYY
jgi:hypothetical protein